MTSGGHIFLVGTGLYWSSGLRFMGGGGDSSLFPHSTPIYSLYPVLPSPYNPECNPESSPISSYLQMNIHLHPQHTPLPLGHCFFSPPPLYIPPSVLSFIFISNPLSIPVSCHACASLSSSCIPLPPSALIGLIPVLYFSLQDSWTKHSQNSVWFGGETNHGSAMCKCAIYMPSTEENVNWQS